MQQQITTRAYTDAGNDAVVALIDPEASEVLDVGCGCGDTAALLRKRDPHKRIYGLTGSPAEAAEATKHLEKCWVTDLESELPPETNAHRFDVLVFSHVLEHLRDPQLVLKRLVQTLRPGGTCIIAVPNVMMWRQRWEFMCGRFEYQKHGTMDETHLRFFSYDSAAPRLLAETPELELLSSSVTGSVPLWVLRRHILPASISRHIDQAATLRWPNLFGSQVLLKCRKRGAE
jgi:ubiquinone/menaquinone biosynthesis C-methylase UbiE